VTCRLTDIEDESLVEPNILASRATDEDTMMDDDEEGSDGEESEYEEGEEEEGKGEGEVEVDGEEEVEEGDVGVVDDVAMAVVPAAPAAQDDGLASGIVKSTLNEGEHTSASAQSSPSPTTCVIAAPSATHLAPSLPTSNAASPPSEKPKRMITQGKRMYFGGEPCCKMGVSEVERDDNESVVECLGTGCETRWVSTFLFELRSLLAYLETIQQYHIRCLDRSDTYWKKRWKCRMCKAEKHARY
jgi:hypothetical protein